jgi:hypothetical protein
LRHRVLDLKQCQPDILAEEAVGTEGDFLSEAIKGCLATVPKPDSSPPIFCHRSRVRYLFAQRGDRYARRTQRNLAVFMHGRVFRRPHGGGCELAWLTKTAREKTPFSIDEWSGVRKCVSPCLVPAARLRGETNKQCIQRISTGDQRACRRLKIGSILTDLIKC